MKSQLITLSTNHMGALSVTRHAETGFKLAHFRAQLEDVRDTSLTLQLNLRTFGTHPPVTLGHMGHTVSLG